MYNVQLADFGSTSHMDSKYTKQGAPIGAPIWKSPEALFKQPWDTATDVWSFGTLISIPFEYFRNHPTALVPKAPIAKCRTNFHV